jgi:ATP-binding cassette subfamily G (WHITE) protein 2 (SNQ2)
MVGALRWIRHVNPMRYAFASIMINEFKSIRGSCANLIPQGPGYENTSLANQVCGSVGALPGEDHVDGSEFLRLSFGYERSELWRNCGILIGFGAGFIGLLLFFSEYISVVGLGAHGSAFGIADVYYRSAGRPHLHASSVAPSCA